MSFFGTDGGERVITASQIQAVIGKANLGEVVWCAQDAGGVLRSDRLDAYEVRLLLPKEGLYAVVLVPPDASIERVAADVDGAVAGLRRMSSGFKANRYDPEVSGPSFAGWLAERELWLAKVEHRATTPDFDAIAELRNEVVEMADRTKRTLKLHCHICGLDTEGPYEVAAQHAAAKHEQWRAERAAARAAELFGGPR